MKARIIIVGGNKSVYFLARQFIQRGDHVTIINRHPIHSKELAQQTKATVVLGDGADIGRLEEAGARRADVVLALTSHDQDNLIICQIAKKIFGVPRTLGLINDPDNEVVFQKLGVDVVFNKTKVIVSMIDQIAHFEDIATLMPIAQGRINVTDVVLDSASPAVNKSLQELELTEGSLIACIVRDDEMVVPRGSTRLLVGDHLILISQPETQEKDLIVLCGAS